MSRRKHTRRPGGRGRRNLILFSLVIAGLAGLIAWVGTVNRAPKRILPPESPEMTVKRESPDNAFCVLMKPWPDLPSPPGPLMVPYSSTNPKLTERYEPRMHSIGKLLNINRPDDDEALGMYLYACAPIVANGQEALTKEFFLYPAIGTPLTRWQHNDEYYSGRFDHTIRMLTAYMLCTAKQGKRERQAAGYFADAVRFVEMLGGDGGLSYYRSASDYLRTILQYAADAAMDVEDPEHLRAMRDAVNRITLHEQPARPYVEFTWREIDNWAEKGYHAHIRECSQRRGHGVRRSRRPDRIVAHVMEAWDFKRHCKALREVHEQLVQIAELTHREFNARRQGDLAELDERLPFSWRGGFGDAERFIIAREGLHNAVRAAGIAFSLELYRRDHGGYPETLDALAPDYVDSVPSPVYADIPFIYRIEDDDYWLYPGPERDDFARMKENKKYRYVFHCPREEGERSEGPGRRRR